MKKNFIKKIVSLTMTAAMLSTFAAGTCAFAENDVEWGYQETFDNLTVGSTIKIPNVTYSKAVAGDENNKYVPGQTFITIDKFPQEKCIVEVDMTLSNVQDGAYAFVELRDINHTAFKGTRQAQSTEGTYTLRIEYTPTEADLANNQLLIASDYTTAKATMTLDNIKVYIDGEDIIPAPTYDLDLTQYDPCEYVWGNEYVSIQDNSQETLDNRKVQHSGNEKYLINPQIAIKKVPSKYVYIEATVEPATEGKYASYWSYKADNGSLIQNGWNSVDKKTTLTYMYEASALPVTGTVYNFGQKDTNFDSKVTDVKVWFDGIETEKTTWGYSNNFDAYAQGEDPSNVSVIYNNTVYKDGTDGYINSRTDKETEILIDGFPQTAFEFVANMTNEDGFGWYRAYGVKADGTLEEVVSWTTFDQGAMNGKNGIYYEPTAAHLSAGYTKMRVDLSRYVKFDDVKIYLDGENLQAGPAFTFDVSKYDVGETVVGTEWLEIQNNTIKSVTGTTCLLDPVLYIKNIPNKNLRIEVVAQRRDTGSDEYGVSHHLKEIMSDGTENHIWWNTIGKEGTIVINYNKSELRNKDAAGLKFYFGQTDSTNLYHDKVTSIKIWYEGIEEVPATWEEYTPYTYMNDFEGDNVGTSPVGEYVTFQGKVAETNGNKELAGTDNAFSNGISFTKIPQKNFIISFDTRYNVTETKTSADTEQLQIWMYGGAGVTARQITQHYSAYFDDTNPHAFVLTGDIQNNTLNAYIDGELVTSHMKNPWTADDVNYIDFSKLDINIYDMYIDNLKICIDTETLYAGGFITDANGNKLNSFTSNATVKGAVFGASYLRNDNPAQMILALYSVNDDGSMKLEKADISDINIRTTDKFAYGEEFEIGTLDADKDYCLRAFVWDSVTKMNPFALVSQINNTK